MATIKNKVNLIGRIGMIHDLQNASNGNAFSRFSIAIANGYKDKSGKWIDDTMWINLMLFGKDAERFAKTAQKGMEIAIEGKLSNRQYEAKDGTKRYSTDVQVDEFFLLNVKSVINA